MSSSYKLRLRRTVLNWRWLLISPGLVIGVAVALPLALIGSAARGYLMLAGNAYMWSIKRITP